MFSRYLLNTAVRVMVLISKNLVFGLISARRLCWGGDSGAAIVPGKSAESKLIHFVTAADPDNAMPPKGTRLTEAEVNVLRAWIDDGAKWPDSHANAKWGNLHWAYQPLRVAPPPVVKHTEWLRNEIDHFVLATLEAKNIEPSPGSGPLHIDSSVEFRSDGAVAFGR